jgi:hypothetical protein
MGRCDTQTWGHQRTETKAIYARKPSYSAKNACRSIVRQERPSIRHIKLSRHLI